MDLADKELIDEFVVESQEGLANVESQMLAIESAGVGVNVDQVNAVFRTMHSIKGAAGFLGLDRIGKLAHGLEEVLDDLRNREIIPTSELVTTILKSADYMKELIDAVDSSNDADITAYVTDLHRFRAGAATTDHAATPAPSQPEAAESTDDACEMLAVEVAECDAACTAAPATEYTPSDAVREFVVECYENLDQMERDLIALEQDPTAVELVRSAFRTMHTIKGGASFLGLSALEALGHASEDLLGHLRNGKQTLNSEMASALLAAADKCRDGLRLVVTTGSDATLDITAVIERLHQVDGVAAPCETPAPKATPAPAPTPTPPTAAAAETTTTSAEANPSDKCSTATSDSTIRVDVALLDKLMTRVGELVLARNQILQHISSLDDATFTNTAQRLNLITTELQEGVMKTRMQPIGNVWSKFPRVVRDLSAQLGKQVQIEMEGKDTELDKTIVEAIKDPLTHLIRNSVDHGIESPEARRAAGKPPEGRLCLRAYHEGGQVNIEITDDGAGLNLERIRRKAIERGLVTADQAGRMTDREAAQLILLPGFSTAEQVTSVSGRGVGMDVVKTNIERIGGTLDVQSQPGHGTTVKIKIPLTLAIIPALVVTCGGDRYAIPQVSLLELVRLEGENARRGIEQLHGAPVYRLRGQLLPIVYLNQELGVQAASDAKADSLLNIVVLRADDRQFGLVVDAINDTEEIVVKPLSKQLKGIAAYAGATIMGDGKVALILDVLGTAQQAHVVTEHRDRAIADHTAQTVRQGTDRQTLLLLQVGQRQIGMPISLVARLEEIDRDRVEQADHQEVVQYRGEIMPLVRLSSLLDIPSEEDPGVPMQVIVYTENGRSLGFVVDRIADIVEADVSSTRTCASEELLASTVVQNRVTDLLNLPSVIKRLDPRCFGQPLAV